MYNLHCSPNIINNQIKRSVISLVIRGEGTGTGAGFFPSSRRFSPANNHSTIAPKSPLPDQAAH
jgi:hypothetical protein